jgi:xylan 1,4-beta-xylosidase
VPVNTEPVLPGFHSDPTVCRSGHDFFLACSSFEYFPGAPVYHSIDLQDWTQIGNVIDRSGQTDLLSGGPSSGIYGSTLRYHDGRFWFVTTNINGRSGQLVFSADDPAGPWSDPVAVPAANGIDPDLAWDEDHTCYLTWCGTHPDGSGGIMQLTIDPTTGAALGSPRPLWSGTGMRNPEGPHLYQVGDWWYLLLAEGGTGLGHSVSVARAREPRGPYEPCPLNPIFTHRSTDHPVQSVGHADLVDTPDGRWFATFHGTRPRGGFPEFHVLGRETFLATVEWQDSWPVFIEHDLPAAASAGFCDDFRASLHHRWVSPSGCLAGVATGSGGLLLDAGESTRPVVTRVTDRGWVVRATLDVSEGSGRALVYLDDHHWYGVDLTAGLARGVARIGPLEQVLGEAAAPGPQAVVQLRAAPNYGYGGPDEIHLELVTPQGVHDLGALDGRYLSTEVAGGFTGRMVGLQATAGVLAVTRFAYNATGS